MGYILNYSAINYNNCYYILFHQTPKKVIYFYLNLFYCRIHCCYSYCRGRSFLHVRMQENIEINNPMYIQDDIDDEDIHLDRAFPLQEKVRHSS